MNPSSGAPSATPLVVETVSQDRTTRITMRGRADAASRGHVRSALSAIESSAARVELALARLDFCDVETVSELVDFASEVRDRGGQVVLAAGTPWVVVMLTVVDVGGAITMPPIDAGAPTAPWLTAGASPEQAIALRQLLTALDHDGSADGSLLVQASDGGVEGAARPALWAAVERGLNGAGPQPVVRQTSVE